MTTKKNFADLIKAYKFFKDYSNEYEENLREIITNLEKNNFLRQGLSMLDFGGGDGELLCDLYAKTILNKFNPKIYLFEPVMKYQKSAKLKLASVGYNQLNVIKKIDDIDEAVLDIILIKHVLYYVEDVGQVISKLKSKLNDRGQLWILMADDDNSLIRLWREFFKILGIEVPYFLIKDLKLILDRESMQYTEKKEIRSVFNFSNSLENRDGMIRFLLGNYSRQFSDKTIEKKLLCYESNGKINLSLSDSLFMVKK